MNVGISWDLMDEDLVAIAKIVKVQGNRGEVRILSLTDFPERFKNLKKVILSFPNKPQGAFTCQYTRYYKNNIILKFLEIDSIEKAVNLVGAELVIPRSELVPLEKDEYYQFEIINLQVFTEDGRYLGKIDSIFPTGSNDVYVVKGKDKKEYLIPAIREVITKIDIYNNKMTINPIRGLLEEDDI